MKFITTATTLRPLNASGPFWPEGVTQLALVFWSPDDNRDNLIVYGVDPAQPEVLLFQTPLPGALQGAFIDAVLADKKGDTPGSPTTVHVATAGVGTAAVVIPDTGPKDPSPNAIPTSLKIGITIAGAVSTANKAIELVLANQR